MLSIYLTFIWIPSCLWLDLHSLLLFSVVSIKTVHNTTLLQKSHMMLESFLCICVFCPELWALWGSTCSMSSCCYHQQNSWHITGAEKIPAKWKNEYPLPLLQLQLTIENYLLIFMTMIHGRPMDIIKKTVVWKMILVNCKLTVEKEVALLFPPLPFSSPMAAPFDSGKEIFPSKWLCLQDCFTYLGTCPRARRNQSKLNYSTRMFEERKQ